SRTRTWTPRESSPTRCASPPRSACTPTTTSAWKSCEPTADAHPRADRHGAGPLHRRPGAGKTRGGDRAAQPLAAPEPATRAAGRGRAEEHHYDRPDRHREDRGRPATREARPGPVPEGRGLQVHRSEERRVGKEGRARGARE